jgi:hypothetical protein
MYKGREIIATFTLIVIVSSCFLNAFAKETNRSTILDVNYRKLVSRADL